MKDGVPEKQQQMLMMSDSDDCMKDVPSNQVWLGPFALLQVSYLSIRTSETTVLYFTVEIHRGLFSWTGSGLFRENNLHRSG